MTWKDFLAKAKAVILSVYHWVCTEVGTLLSLLKSKFSRIFVWRIIMILAILGAIILIAAIA